MISTKCEHPVSDSSCSQTTERHWQFTNYPPRIALVDLRAVNLRVRVIVWLGVTPTSYNKQLIKDNLNILLYLYLHVLTFLFPSLNMLQAWPRLS